MLTAQLAVRAPATNRGSRSRFQDDPAKHSEHDRHCIRRDRAEKRGRFAKSVVERRHHELIERSTENLRQLDEQRDSWQPHPAFQHPDKVNRNVQAFGEDCLRPISLFSSLANRFAELPREPSLLVDHPGFDKADPSREAIAIDRWYGLDRTMRTSIPYASKETACRLHRFLPLRWGSS